MASTVGVVVLGAEVRFQRGVWLESECGKYGLSLVLQLLGRVRCRSHGVLFYKVIRTSYAICFNEKLPYLVVGR